MKKIRIILLLVFLITGMANVFAQEKFGKTPEEQLLCKEALSVYQSQYKSKDAQVYVSWQKAFNACPCTASQNMLTQGVKLLKKEIKSADDARKTTLVDSLFLVYNKRIETYPSTSKKPNNGCSVSARMAMDMLKYQPEKKDEVNTLLEESIDCVGNGSLAAVLWKYYELSYNKMKELKETDVDAAAALKEKMLLKYLPLQDICDYNIKNATKDKKKEGYIKTKTNIDELFVILADCETMIPLLKDKVTKDPDNFDLKKKVLRLMNKKDCVDDPFYLEIAEAVCAIEPSSSCQYSIGMGYLKASPANTTKALEYFEKAVEIGQDDPDYARYILRSAQLASSKGQTGKANGYANQLLKINPNDGKALMIKAEGVLAKARSCNDALGCGYLCAGDAFARAKAKDPSIAKEANKRIRACKAGFPTNEAVFNSGKKVGDTIKCSCTGTSTVIRLR